MKRGADAMDGGFGGRDDGRRSGESDRRRRPELEVKRARRGEQWRSRYGPVGTVAPPSAGSTSAPGDPKSPNKREKSGSDGKSVGSSSGCGSGSGATVKLLADEKETDPHRLAQRQKQIDYGKNTIGYDRYCVLVPRHQRRPGKHPMTPDKTARMGKKVFDGHVRRWRQALHKFDPPELTQATTEATSVTTVTQDTSSSAHASSATAATDEASTTTETQTPAPPSRSIFENFEEDELGQADDSDDDLL